jgi:hypothetical protein
VPDNPTVPWLSQPVDAEDIGGNIAQRVKIALGAHGVGISAPGDGVNGMDVDVTRVQGIVQVQFATAQVVGIDGTATVSIPGIVVVEDCAIAPPTVTLVGIVDGEVVLAAENNDRHRLKVFNDTQRTMLIKEGAGVSPSSFSLRLGPQKLWEMDRQVTTSVVTGMWEGFEDGDEQGAMVTEG